MSILRFVPRRRPGPAGEYQKSTSIIYRPDAFFKKSLIFFEKICIFLFTNPEFRV